MAKKKRRLQRRVSRKYLKNKKGESYCKTSSIIKSQKQLLKINRKLTNICHNHLHQVTAEIVKRKPSFIVLEDLNVKGMMKNRHLAKAIQGVDRIAKTSATDMYRYVSREFTPLEGTRTCE